MTTKTTLGIAVAASVLAATVAMSATAAGQHRTVHFTDTSVGASIGGNRSVAVVHDPSSGQGASVETLKLNGLSGTGRIITYWGTGTTTDVVKFKVGVPNANGISTLAGSGRQVSATGEFKGSKSSSRFSGTYDTKTTISHVTIKGTATT
jgi:hypothetical protein